MRLADFRYNRAGSEELNALSICNTVFNVFTNE